MKLQTTRLTIITWALIGSLCIAIPYRQSPSNIVQSLPDISQRAANDGISRRTQSNVFHEHQNTPTNIRRGSGGSASAIEAIGSYQLRTKHFKTLTTILPAILAASYISDFLDTIALRVETGFWNHEPPTKHRVIHMWSFELDFQSSHAPIPWDFVQDYVIGLAEDVAKGFVGTFEEVLAGVIGGVATAVTVRLRINNGHPPMVQT